MKPAFETDMAALPADPRRDEHEGYTVVHCPSMPEFWFGNLLVLDDAPTDREHWMQVWRDHLGALPGLQKTVFEWETDAQEVKPAPPGWHGFEFEVCAVLQLSGAPTPRYETPWTPRILTAEPDWQAVGTLVRRELPRPGTEEFVARRFGQYRERAEAGHGDWWGLFDGSTAVGSAGLFRSGSLARFREVVVATAQRRKGGCTHLLAAMIDDARERGVADRFILVADPESAARRLYEALGFRVIGHQYALVADV